MSDQPLRRAGNRAPGRVVFAVVGLVSVAVTIALGQLISTFGQFLGVLGTPSSPVTALADSFIGVTPEWLKHWAIATFGTHDKVALLTGMAVVLMVAAAVIGVLARTRLAIAELCALLLLMLTLVAVWTRTGAEPFDGLPTGLGGLAGVFVLGQAARRVVGVRPRHSAASHQRAAVVVPMAGGPGLEPTRLHPRRHVLKIAGMGAGVAAVAGLLARIIPGAAGVEASRARIKVPIVGGASSTPRATPPSGGWPPSIPPPSTSVAGSFGSAGPGSATSVPPSAGGSGPPPAVSSQDPASAGETGPAPSTERIQPGTSLTSAAPVMATDSVPGLSPFLTPNADFYRIDTTVSPPLVRAEDWTLRVHGMVGEEFTINYAELTARPQVERQITLTCVSNAVAGHLVGNASWIGVRIAELLIHARPGAGADCVLATSIDGFTTTTPLEAVLDGRDALLAVAMNGEPLPIEHGFPVRMVVPGLYGYVSANKWVVDLEVTRFAAVSAYWTTRGWSESGPVKTSSRIDVPADSAHFSTGQLVTFAGVAWAQHRGVSAVEIQIDDRAWQRCALSGLVSVDTWRQWEFQWSATPGMHQVRCRAADGSGAVQDAQERDSFPDGSTGLAGISVSVS